MPYIGKSPTAVPLSASDLNDDIISLAKLASGTDGNLITYDASGNPVAVATGDDGQILTSAGAGQPCAFEAAAGGGGAWNKILTQTITSTTASMDFIDGTGGCVFDNTYRRYVVLFDDYRPITDNTELHLYFYQSSAFLTSGYQTTAAHVHGGTSSTYTGTGYASALNACNHDAAEIAYGEIHFINPSSTVTKPSCYSRFCTINSNGGETNQHISAGGHNTAGAYTGFQFIPNSGNIANLQATLYGIST